MDGPPTPYLALLRVGFT